MYLTREETDVFLNILRIIKKSTDSGEHTQHFRGKCGAVPSHQEKITQDIYAVLLINGDAYLKGAIGWSPDTIQGRTLQHMITFGIFKIMTFPCRRSRKTISGFHLACL